MPISCDIIRPTALIEAFGDWSSSIISWYKDGKLGNASICDISRLSLSSANKSLKAQARDNIDFNVSASQGFDKYWCIRPTERRIASLSA